MLRVGVISAERQRGMFAGLRRYGRIDGARRRRVIAERLLRVGGVAGMRWRGRIDGAWWRVIDELRRCGLIAEKLLRGGDVAGL